MNLFIPDDEIDAICRPLKQPAAQRRYLERAFGVKTYPSPTGKPRVLRADFDRLAGRISAPPAEMPDAEALLRRFRKREAV